MFVILIILTIIGLFTIRNYRRFDIEVFADKKDGYRYFYPAALFLYDMAGRYFKVSISRSTKEKLKILREENYVEYVAKRGAGLIALFLGILCLAMFVEISYKKDNILNGNLIARPEAGENSFDVELKANDGESDYIINATVSPKALTEEQAYEMFDKAYEEVLEIIPAKNSSLSEITSSLKLVTKCQKDVISVSWLSSDRSIVENDGTVRNQDLKKDEAREVVLTATFSYGKYEAAYDIYLTVIRPDYSGQEEFKIKLLEAVSLADEKNIYDRNYALPESVGGKDITYQRTDKNYSWLIFLAGSVAICVIIFTPDAQVSKKLKSRELQMLLDYSEIISKLNLLLGSGMTVRKAWERMVQDYRNTETKRYAYEEMAAAYNRIETGFSEIACYEEFAQRCRVQEYTKLVSILTQNMKKGNEGLTQKLSLEMQMAFEQRKNIARKLGEEASTKLLVPMIMLLLIVMVIVMVPVFMAF